MSLLRDSWLRHISLIDFLLKNDLVPALERTEGDFVQGGEGNIPSLTHKLRNEFQR